MCDKEIHICAKVAWYEMAPSAQVKLKEPETTTEVPKISESNKTGIRGVLLGPPGSGKGTQVEYIASKYS